MKRIILAVALGLLVGVWVWNRYGGDRDARRIHGRFDELVSIVEKTEPTNQLRILSLAQQVPEFFSPDATITLAPMYSGNLTRREVTSYLARAHQALDRLTIRISDRRLDIDRDNDTALLRFTAHGSLEIGSNRDSQLHAFELRWIKTDGDWYIQRATTIQTIRRPGAED